MANNKVKVRLDSYISKENKSKLKMFSFEKQMTVSNTLDEILSAFFKECENYGGEISVQNDK